MPYLIDSDIVIDHLANIKSATDLLETLAEGIAVSIITYMETYQGVLRSSHPTSAHSQFQAFLETVPFLPFSLAVAERCASLRETLKKEGKRVKARALDLMTAAVALENSLTLVTRNSEDYKDIPDLLLYD
jgi:tRNA(fMet)-specific endonuclease VapC